MKVFSGAFKFISSVVSGAFNLVANLFRDPALQAMGRAGLGELSQILPAFNDGVKPVETYGLLGNPLPQTLHENLQSYNALEAEHNHALESEMEMQM